jgi:hypothetical protein
MEAVTVQIITHIALIGWLAMVTQSALATTPVVNVGLKLREIAPGNAGELRVGLSSVLGNQGTLPVMEGLAYARTGRSSQYVSTSGEVRESQSLVQLATATRARTTTNPALETGSGGHAGSSSPVALRGTGSGSTPAPNVSQSVRRDMSSVEPGLAPNQAASGGLVSVFRRHPLLSSILIVYSVSLAGIAATSYSFRRRVRLARNNFPLRASLAGRIQRGELATIAEMMQQAEAGDFFVAARSALQDQLAARWGVSAEAITLAEIKTRMNGDAGDLCSIFEMADRLAHRRGRLSSVDLAYWLFIVRKELGRWK